MIFRQLSIALGVISLIGFFASSGKQKRISAFLLGLSLLLGIISFSAPLPYPQPPSGQSESQEQQLVPPPSQNSPSMERVVVAGRKLTLGGDGTYIVPAGKKSLCFTALGKIDGSEITDQTLDITHEGETLTYTTLGTECFSLPDNMKGSISIDFFPGKTWGDEPVLSNMYRRYRALPGGQGEWPVIRIGE